MCVKLWCMWERVCVKLLYVKFVCEVIVCERWYVTKLCVWVCVKLLYVRFVCVKLWYVTCVEVVIVCERWYVTKLCVCECVYVWSYCMLSLCVWSYCMWEMVCDKVVCVSVCEVMVCDMCGGGGGRRSRGRRRPGIQNQKQEPHTKLWGKRSPCQNHFLLSWCRFLERKVKAQKKHWQITSTSHFVTVFCIDSDHSIALHFLQSSLHHCSNLCLHVHLHFLWWHCFLLH